MRKGSKHSENSLRKMRQSLAGRPAWNKGIFLSDTHRKNISAASMGRKVWNKRKKGAYSTSYIKKLSDSHKGQKSPMEGKKHTNETKKKLRIARCKWIKNIGGGPQFNPIACEFLDKLGFKRGWDIRHAMNGGEFFIEELGYWLDGYDENRNIVIEYDEPFHHKTIQKIKDCARQKEIISHLKPRKFFRYDEKLGKLKRII